MQVSVVWVCRTIWFKIDPQFNFTDWALHFNLEWKPQSLHDDQFWSNWRWLVRFKSHLHLRIREKKMSYWNSQAKRRVINCGNRIGNWKRLGGIVTEGCKSVSTIFPLIRIQYEAERKTSGFKVMLDIFIPQGFFVEAVLLNKGIKKV